MDKGYLDLKGPGFWKLDEVNAEAVQANLKVDLQRISIKHHEEVMKLMAKQRLLTIGEPIGPTTTQVDESILNILEDEDEPVEFG